MKEIVDFFGDAFEIQKYDRNMDSHWQKVNITHHHSCRQCGGRTRRQQLHRERRAHERSVVSHCIQRSDFDVLDHVSVSKCSSW
jgi:hypothetical protein